MARTMADVLDRGTVREVVASLKLAGYVYHDGKTWMASEGERGLELHAVPSPPIYARPASEVPAPELAEGLSR
jgi:hypothetical protein